MKLGPNDSAFGFPGFRTRRTLSMIGFFDFSGSLGHLEFVLKKGDSNEVILHNINHNCSRHAFFD